MNHLTLPAALALTLSLSAQSSYWIANRTSADIMRVSEWGSVLERVATPTALRGCTTAPDGKVWIVRFIQTTFDIYNPATQTFTAVPLPLGSTYAIAFDAAGHAWITSAGTAVHEYDANGTFLQTVTTTAGSGLGITIDSFGHKWVAHRVTPPSVSKIDTSGAVPVVTNFPITLPTTMLPVGIIADYRGLTQPSRIWVAGDSASAVAEIDSVTGATLNVYTVPVSTSGVAVPAFDAAGRIWLGSFASGSLVQMDQTNGSALQTLSLSGNNISVTTDNFGRIRATNRVTTSLTSGLACEVRRIDPVTGAVEIPTVLKYGTFNGVGTQWQMSTQWQYGLVVNPLGDMDGDNEANFGEILNGTSPTDATSTSFFGHESFGTTSIGSTATIRVTAPTTQTWLLGLGFGLASPTQVPGFGGLLLLNQSLLASLQFGIGATSIPLAIPASTTLQGLELFTQGAAYNSATSSFDFKNVSGILAW